MHYFLWLEFTPPSEFFPRMYRSIVHLPPYTVIISLFLCLPQEAKSFKSSWQCLSHLLVLDGISLENIYMRRVCAQGYEQYLCGNDGSKIGQREELKCLTVTTNTTWNPRDILDNSKAGMAPSESFHVKAREVGFHCSSLVSGYRRTLQWGKISGKAAFTGWGQFPDNDSAKSCQLLPILPKAGGAMSVL